MKRASKGSFTQWYWVREQETFRLAVKKIFTAVRVVMHLDRLTPRNCAASILRGYKVQSVQGPEKPNFTSLLTGE